MVDAPPALVRPVQGSVASTFRYERRTPYRRGWRRVVRWRVSPGAVVVAPCRGRVAYAGRAPGTRVVTVRCGAWSASLSGVGSPAVGRGGRVAIGRRIGRTAGTTVALGLRPTADRLGYVDPAALFRDPGSPRGTPVVPRQRMPRTVAPRTAPVPRGVPVPRAVPVPRRAPAPDAVPGGAPARAPRSAPVRGGAPRPLRPRAPAPVVVPAPAPAVRPVAAPAGHGPPLLAWVALAFVALALPTGATVARRTRTARRGARPAERARTS